MEIHEKTHHHVKRAQLLIIVAIGINLAMFVVMYAMLSGQIGSVSNRVNTISSNVDILDNRVNQNFQKVGSDIVNLSGGLQENTQNIGIMNLLLEQMGDEIVRVGEESQAGIQSIKSELNYTGTINTALESVLLIVWTDKESVVGSGFLVSEDGYLLTADHVVDVFDGKTVRARTMAGKIYVASVIERNEDVDVAVLKISATNISYLEFGDSDHLFTGSKVFALGAPEGFGFSATEGIVSAVRSVKDIKKEVGLDLGLDPNAYVVQTDAAITHGNSGGPLIDKTGKIVGLNSFGISTGSRGDYQDVEGLNFAISSNNVRGVYEAAV
jgi:S1-C subfamily serine protease